MTLVCLNSINIKCKAAYQACTCRLVGENKWYKDHSLLIFKDESLLLFYYGDTYLSCIGNDNFGVSIQNVFVVLFVTQTYRSFLLMRHTFSPSCYEIGLVMTLNK